MKLHEIDTPALLLDLDAMERNLAKMLGSSPSARPGCARITRTISVRLWRAAKWRPEPLA